MSERLQRVAASVVVAVATAVVILALAMAPFLNMVAVPLLLLSGLLLPMSLGPAWLRTVSQVSPLTHAVTRNRSLDRSVTSMA